MNYFLLTLVIVYIVDVSGFTSSWRALVARLAKIHETQLRPLPPLDCSTCMCWWTLLIFSLLNGESFFSSLVIAAFSAFLAPILSQIILLIRESTFALISRLFDKLDQ